MEAHVESERAITEADSWVQRTRVDSWIFQKDVGHEEEILTYGTSVRQYGGNMTALGEIPNISPSPSLTASFNW